MGDGLGRNYHIFDALASYMEQIADDSNEKCKTLVSFAAHQCPHFSKGKTTMSRSMREHACLVAPRYHLQKARE